MTMIACNEFVKRQTKESKYGYFDGSWEELASLVQKHFSNQKQGYREGYREGVILVSLPIDRFYTSIVEVTTETKIDATFQARREGELPYINLAAKGGEKIPASSVEIVLYSKEVLKENNENTTEADWEIVSINCSPLECGVPMPPMTRARNNLKLQGGTDSKFEELNREDLINLVRGMSNEIVFWNTHLMLE